MMILYIFLAICAIEGLAINMSALIAISINILERYCPKFALWNARRKEAKREKREAKKVH